MEINHNILVSSGAIAAIKEELAKWNTEQLLEIQIKNTSGGISGEVSYMRNKITNNFENFYMKLRVQVNMPVQIVTLYGFGWIKFNSIDEKVIQVFAHELHHYLFKTGQIADPDTEWNCTASSIKFLSEFTGKPVESYISEVNVCHMKRMRMIS